MKMFPKTQDETIDRLLRAQGGASGKEVPLCREFDADLANAYVERSLRASERASYENHLAACSPCRKAIVALTRMADAETVAARGVAATGQARGASGIRQWLGALTVPQWAMAAAAVIVLAITLPLVLSHRSRPENTPAVPQESGPPSSELSARAMTAPTGTDEASNSNTAHDASAPAHAATAEKPATNEKNEAPAQPARAADGVSSGTATALAQTAQPKSVDQTAAKAEAPAPPSAAPAAEPAKPQASEVAKDQEKQNPAAKETTASQSDKRADAASVAGNIAPPPPPPTRTPEASRARERSEGPATSVPSIQSFTGVSAAEATTAVSRRIGNHFFSLRGGVWTDKEYKPDKDKPVTIIRDSEVYRSLLAKDAKIEPFLKGFPHDARVIFKFKGVVYKLVPQDNDQ